MEHNIHIGRIIQAKMKADGRSSQWLAQKLNYTVNSVYRIYERPSINTDLLLRISGILQINLFAHYYNLLKDRDII